jgi:hypothetical protein
MKPNILGDGSKNILNGVVGYNAFFLVGPIKNVCSLNL